MARAGVGPLVGFVVCCLIWSTTFLAIKGSNASLDALWGAALRLAIAAIVLVPAWMITRAPFPKGRALGIVLLFGVLDFGVNLGLLYWGEKTVPSGLAAVFYATSPISALLLARAFGQERLDPGRLLATLVALAGVALVFANELRFSADPWALVAVLGAATAASLGSVFLRTIPPQPVIPTVTLGCGVSAILLLPASALVGESWAIPATWEGWGPVLYLALLGSVGAFGLFTWVLNHWSASTATLAGIIVPILAVGVGAIVARERLAWGTLAGGALVIGGVIVALLRARAARPAPPSAPADA